MSVKQLPFALPRRLHHLQPVQKSPVISVARYGLPQLVPTRASPQPASRLPWEPPAGHNFKGERYGSDAWEAVSDVNRAICARDGAPHLLC